MKRDLRVFDQRPTSENLTNFQIFKAKARRTIRQSKRSTWKNYVSKLNSRSSTKATWDMIRKINGKSKYSKLHHLDTANGTITSEEGISTALADAFSANSSSTNCTDEFRRVKNSKQKVKLQFKSNTDESYNQPCSMKELNNSL